MTIYGESFNADFLMILIKGSFKGSLSCQDCATPSYFPPTIQVVALPLVALCTSPYQCNLFSKPYPLPLLLFSNPVPISLLHSIPHPPPAPHRPLVRFFVLFSPPRFFKRPFNFHQKADHHSKNISLSMLLKTLLELTEDKTN